MAAPGARTEVGIELARVAARLRQSTVEVHGVGGATGAGVVWSGDGLIVTNAHVARGPARVIDADGRVLAARLVGWDPERDLAALVVEPADASRRGAEWAPHVGRSRRTHGVMPGERGGVPEGMALVPALEGDPDALRVGDLVVALGHPGGVVGAVTVGVVHAIISRGQPPRPRFIQADLRLSPGNSGGPLADARGRVVGVNAMIASGLAVAITTGTIVAFLGDLRREAAARRRVLFAGRAPRVPT